MILGHQISADNRRKHVNPSSLCGYQLGNAEESAAWCTRSRTVCKRILWPGYLQNIGTEANYFDPLEKPVGFLV